jgi:CHAD domain-containing protein
MSYRLSFDESPSTAAVSTMAGQLEQAIDRLGRGRGQDPAGALHDARKNLKKSRSLLRLMRGGLPRKTYRREMRFLRDCGRALSGARDADALVATLSELSDRYVGQIPATAFEQLETRLADRARAAEARADLGAVGEITVLRQARGRLETWPTEKLSRSGFAKELGRAYRRGHDAMQSVRRDPTVANLHEWRKRVKDLWYQQRLLQEAWSPVLKAQATQAHELADLLGGDHDLAVLSSVMRRDDGPQQNVPADTDPVIELAEHRREELQAQALLLGQRIYGERPKAFSRRIRGLVEVAEAEVEAGSAAGSPSPQARAAAA